MIGRNAAMALFTQQGVQQHTIYITPHTNLYSILRSNHFYSYLYRFQEVFFADKNQAFIQHIANIATAILLSEHVETDSILQPPYLFRCPSCPSNDVAVTLHHHT